MELLKELLGFVVLTGPLLLIIVWLPVSLWAATRISKRYTRGSLKRKFSIGVLLFIAIFLIPFADGIAGRFYFNYLCATKAGVKVYQTVELPAEYWDEEGRAKFIKNNGDLDNVILGGRFDEPAFTEPYSPIFGIDERHHQLVDKSDSGTLGEVINYMYWGGWVSRNLSPNRSASDCKEFRGNKFWNDFYSELIKSKNSSE